MSCDNFKRVDGHTLDMSQQLLLVKLGGSLITDKSQPYTERKEVIERLAREINRAKRARDFKMVLGHGGGSYPHQSASKYQTQQGVISENSYRGISKVQDDAAKLNRIVFTSLLAQDLNPYFISPSASLIAAEGEIKNWYLKPLRQALAMGNLPVVYGDVALDEVKGCCILSTEQLLEHLALELAADKIVLCGKYNGVFSEDPSQNPEAEKIARITPATYSKIEDSLSGSDSADVTGGMLHKVKRCVKLAEKGIKCEIIGAREEGRLERVLKGKDGLGTVVKSDS